MNLDSITYTIDTYLKQEDMSETSLLYWKSECEQNYYDGKIHYFSNTDDINNIEGTFEVGLTAQKQPIGSNLIEFLNIDFTNFKEFFVYFSKYFGKYYTNFTIDELDIFETSLAHSNYNNLIKLAKSVHTKEKISLKNFQEKLKKAINYIYNIDCNEEIESLTLKQRFYIYQRINNFYDISINDFTYQNSFSFIYPVDFNKDSKKVTEKNLIKRIKEYDPDGTKLTANNYYESSDLGTIFYITLYNLISLPDTYIKVCKNCNRYFITSKSNTVFCENLFYEDKTCREIGNQLFQKKKENEDYVYGKYRKIYAKKAMAAKRNLDISNYADEYEAWKKKAKKFMNDIRDGKKTYEEFDKWLDEKN